MQNPLSFRATPRHTARLFISLVLTALAVGSHAESSAHQSLIAIQAAAEQHLHEALAGSTATTLLLRADTLDNRLRLAACQSPLQTFLPNGASIGNRATVGVRCTSGNGWSVYVPVNIECETTVLRLNKAMSRDAIVTALDIEARTERVPGTRSQYLDTATALTGMRLKRDLPAGTLLTPAMLQPQLLVKRGQQVTLLATVAGIEVRNQGVALADGGVNTRLKVKNLGSAQVVEGVVDSNGIVRVTL